MHDFVEHDERMASMVIGIVTRALAAVISALGPSARVARVCCVSFSMVVSGALADLNDIAFDSELERLAARANQASYDQIKATTGCDEEQSAATAACAGGTFIVWRNVRELVHTANDITNSGPTLYSLNQNTQQLGATMRWTSGEEFASQGSMSSNFVNGQLSGLAARITALRSGATGFRWGAADASGYEQLARQYSRGSLLGGGASADQPSSWSRWGGFINFNYVAGSRQGTDLEDAFDYDGGDINGGFDYRLGDRWVLGTVLGYQEQLLDFDSSQSVVDGEVEGTGYSIMPFVLYQTDQWYWTASLGFQRMTFDTERRISYPSFNPDIASTNTESSSATSSQTLSAYASAGYTFRPTLKMTLEPYVGLDFYRIHIDEYSEADLQNDGFNFIVEDQRINYAEGIIALKLQYVFTPRFAVLVPYVDAQWHHQFETAPREIEAIYEDAASTLAANPNARFLLPTDALDENYEVYTVGVSAVLRGARQTEIGGSASGGVQIYVQASVINNLEYYTQQGFSMGLRYEF